MYFLMQNQNLKSFFIARNWKPSIIWKKVKKNTKIPCYQGFPALVDEIGPLDTGFTFCRSKNSHVPSISAIQKILSIPKYQDRADRQFRISCNLPITVTEKRLKNILHEGFTNSFFFITVLYFDVQNSNPMSIFVGHEWKTSI